LHALPFGGIVKFQGSFKCSLQINQAVFEQRSVEFDIFLARSAGLGHEQVSGVKAVGNAMVGAFTLKP
jgi:hypothetical protein